MRVILTAIFTIWAAVASAELRIGVLAPQGIEQAQTRWQGLIDSWATELNMQIDFLPLRASEVPSAMQEGQIDLLLANPVQSALVADQMRARALASMISNRGTEFGGVILVNADSDIQALGDLAGQSFASLSDHAAGGYLYQSAHLMMKGQPRPDMIARRVFGKNQNELVDMLVSGAADAAFVRTGVLESLIAKGTVSAGQLRVLDDKKSGPDDLHRTTSWYPEWFLMAHPNAERALLDRFLVTVLNMNADSDAAKTARVQGFQMPLDLTNVTMAMQIVGVAPYN